MEKSKAGPRLIKAALALVVAGATFSCLASVTQEYTFDGSFANGTVIPDGNISGWMDTRQVDWNGTYGSGWSITDVSVTLSLSGGWNGDLYGYLVHESGFAVLLNRVGVTGDNPWGSSAAGMTVILNDSSTLTDLHSYTINGSYNTDGRNVDPLTVNGTEIRDATLASFNNMDPNGGWTLFLADLSGGDVTQVTSWSLEITAVPEPTTWALLGFAGLFAGVGAVRWVRSHRNSCHNAAQFHRPGFAGPAGGKSAKKILLLGMVLVPLLAARATIYTTNWNSGFANGGVVPDNNFSGWSDTRIVGAIPAGAFTGLSLDLQLSGGWNGDLYAYLVHSSGFSVLLDHVGVGLSGVGSFGYGDAGMNVNLAATGTSIHQYGGNSTFSAPPAGSWMTDNTSGSLGSFLSTAPNGTWSLFIADLSGGGVTTVTGWGLQMDIVAVPEIETWVAAALAGAFGAFWLNREIWGESQPCNRSDT